MSNGSKLSKKQREVIDDLFTGVTEEQQILDNHKVDRRLFDKWMADVTFVAEFDRRLESARRKSELIIARYATVAASKLAMLTESESQETSRKACLDIIGLLRPDKKQSDSPEMDDSETRPADLPPEIASRLLAALAVKENKGAEQK